MKTTLFSMFAVVYLLMGCNPHTPPLNLNEEVVHYYPNGKVRYRCITDNSGNIHGYCYQYDEKGKLTRKSIHFHGKEVLATLFKNGRRFQLISNFIGDTLSSNVVVTLDANGSVLEEKSTYANIRYTKNRDSLEVELPGFYNDSVVVLFKTSFEDYNNKKSYIRRVRYIKPSNSKVRFAIKSGDYANGKLNVRIDAYDKLGPQVQPKKVNFKVYFPPASQSMLIQLNKEEEPKKYNIDPIWY